MEIRQLRYFLAVAQTGNFSRAALMLHVSQPPLSTQIRQLEEELGVRLFDRGNRGATLTPAGQAFREEAGAALDRLEQARRRARWAGLGEAGTLSVGFVSLADFGILPAVLRQFRARFPRVEVQLHELTTDAQIREIQAARLDLGIGLAPVEEPGLRFEGLAREELVLALATGSALARRTGRIELRALAREDFIVPPRDVAPGLHDLVLGQCQSAGFTPRITQQARQMQTVISLVSAGMGVALVPSSVRQLRRAGVCYRPLAGRPARVELGAIYATAGQNPVRARFLEALRAAG